MTSEGKEGSESREAEAVRSKPWSISPGTKKTGMVSDTRATDLTREQVERSSQQKETFERVHSVSHGRPHSEEPQRLDREVLR
jgi:hypothetical protein